MIIWKKKLDEKLIFQTIDVPSGSKFLTAAMQGENLCLWILCDKNAPTTRREIAIYATGELLDNDPGEYISTFQLEGGDFIYHVFDVK